MKNRGITIENGQRGYLNLKFDGLIVAKIVKKRARLLVDELFAGDGLVLQKKPKKKTSNKKKSAVKLKQEKELRIEAKQFARRYTKMKKKYYKVKAVVDIRDGSADFEKCVGAVRICKRHGVSHLLFLKAQIEGLKWTKQFPELNTLITNGAETRLLEYISKGGNEESLPVKVHITDEERKTPLNANDTYIAYVCYIRSKMATLEQALYVREIQLARKGIVAQYVEDYIDKLARAKGT